MPDFHFVIREPTIENLNRYVHRLLRADWDSPGSALQLASDLTPEQVGSTLFLDQARTFLRLVVESDGVELTPNGWLKLAVVARMLEQMEWPRKHVEELRGVCKRLHEYDVRPITVIRGVGEVARLMRRRRRKLYVPRRVLPLLREESTGQLYRQLFMALFRHADLRLLYGLDETPLLQDSMAVVLWRLRVVAEDWIALKRLPEQVLLDAVRAETESLDRFPDMNLHMLWRRVLEPLVWFGLLERDQEPKRSWEVPPEMRLRKTPLFDRFIRFPPFPLEPPVEAS